jgi:hypothetical protein
MNVFNKRHSDCAADIAREVADTRNLIELLPRDAYVIERTDRDKDQRNPDHLDHAVDDQLFMSGKDGSVISSYLIGCVRPDQTVHGLS